MFLKLIEINISCETFVSMMCVQHFFTIQSGTYGRVVEMNWVGPCGVEGYNPTLQYVKNGHFFTGKQWQYFDALP